MTLLYLIVGGASGTVCRHYLSMWVGDATGRGSLGTFTVNIIGSFAIGVVMVLATERFSWPAATVMLVSVGFLGGFTTFSAFSWQAFEKLEAGDYASAFAYVVGSVACGLAAVWAGATLARAAT